MTAEIERRERQKTKTINIMLYIISIYVYTDINAVRDEMTRQTALYDVVRLYYNEETDTADSIEYTDKKKIKKS